VSGPKPAAEPPAGPVDLPAWLAGILESTLPAGPPAGWVVAFSGGLDSLCLLVALQRLGARRPGGAGIALRAVHVDHGLNPRSAQWARACRARCRELGLPLAVHRVRVAPARGESLEAVAREARYARLRESLRPGEVLLTAHHLDDQLETILLQLMRGAGVSGLAAMPALMPFGRGLHLRPLLSLARRQLQDWARAEGLRWIDDDSNVDPRFDRNYLRHRVLPLLQARWPAAARVAARSAAHLGDARELLADLAALDLASLRRGGALDLDALAMLSAARRRNAVRAWLATRGLPAPDARHLARILGELCAARRDAAPLVAWPGAQVRRHRGWLYALAAPGNAPSAAPREWRWRRAPALELGAGLGSLHLHRDPRGTIAGGSLPATLRVGFRAGGERLRTEAGGPRRTVKELLRAAGVLPWMRSSLPLVHAGDTLVAVADLFVDASVLPAPGQRARYRLEWRDAPAIRGLQPGRAGTSATPDRQ
jgi:tRNA(Ile)-lysidine synthase